MPKRFCFNLNDPEFRTCASFLGISTEQLRFYASAFVNMKGLSIGEFEEYMSFYHAASYAEARKFASAKNKEFFDYIEQVMGIGDKSIEGNFASNTDQLNRMIILYETYNGARLNTIDSNTLKKLRVIFPYYAVYQDSDHITRIQFMMPMLDANRQRETLQESVEKLIKEENSKGKLTTLEQRQLERWKAQFVDRDASAIENSSIETILKDLYTSIEKRVDQMFDSASRFSDEEIAEMQSLFGTNAKQVAYQSAYAKLDEIIRKARRTRDAQWGVETVGATSIELSGKDTITLTSADGRWLAKNFVTHVSFVLNYLTTDRDAVKKLFGAISPLNKYDFTKMDRKEVIDVIGLDKLFDVIDRKFFNRTNVYRRMDGIYKIRLFLQERDKLLQKAYATLLENEDVSLDGIRRDVDKTGNPEYDQFLDELRENYGEERASEMKEYSSFSKVPALVRRFLQTQPELNLDGTERLDPVYGNAYAADGMTRFNQLHNALQQCTSLDEMISCLRILAMTDSDAWVRSLLVKLNEDSEFANQFYTCMNTRKIYIGIIDAYRDEKGVMRSRPVLLSADSVSSMMFSKIESKFNTGNSSMIKTNDSSLFGRGQLDIQHIDEITDRVNAALDLLASMSVDRQRAAMNQSEALGYEAKNPVNDNFIDSIATEIYNILKMFDIDVNEQAVRDTFIADKVTMSKNTVDTNSLQVTKTLWELSRLADRFREMRQENVLFTDTNGNNVYGEFNPFEKLGSSTNNQAIRDIYKSLCDTFAEKNGANCISMVHSGSSDYYTISNPTSFSNVLKQLDLSTPAHVQAAAEYLRKNFYAYKFFNPTGNSNDIPQSIWYKRAEKNMISIKQQLSYHGTEYINMTEREFLASMLAEYFGAGDKLGSYASPVLGEKDKILYFNGVPKYKLTEFTIGGKQYMASSEIIEGFASIALSELNRIRAVFQKAGENYKKFGPDEFSKRTSSHEQSLPMDVNDVEIARIAASILDGGSERLTKEDFLDENGKLKTSIRKSGMTFRFLTKMTDEIINGTSLGEMFLSVINGDKDFSISRLNELMTQKIASMMDEIVNEELAKFEEMGIFETVDFQTHNVVKVKSFVHLDQFLNEEIGSLSHSRLNPVYKETVNDDFSVTQGRTRITGDQAEEIARQINEERRKEAIAFLREFIWNDFFAKVNSTLMFQGDLAAFADATEFFNRCGGLNTPAMRLNPAALDRNGNRFSDGNLRSIYIADKKMASTIKANVEYMLENGISMAQEKLADSSLTEEERKNYENKLESLRHKLDKIKNGKGKVNYDNFNSTDGQAFTSMTGARKKYGSAGQWKSEFEDAYERIMKGEATVDDIDLMSGFYIQPMKPVNLSYETTVYNQNSEPAMATNKTRVYHKCSEYMLAYGGALARGDERANVLKALIDFMEETAYTDGAYNAMGIDTILFESAVKTGAHGVIDLNECTDYDSTINLLRSSVYDMSDSDNMYNIETVHVTPIEDYGIVQNNPAHFSDHMQAMGTQARVMIFNDLDSGGEYFVSETVNGKRVLTKYKGSDIRKEYWNLIGMNIRDSMNILASQMGLSKDATPFERNKAVSDLLVNSIMHDARYGADLLDVVRLDAKGDFCVPLSDPMIAIRVQNLICAQIRDTINKQKMPGGPVVQVSNFGRSDDLNVRFQDADGNLIKTFQEYCSENGLDIHDESSAENYKEDVLKGKQARLAYFEVYLTIPTEEMREALTVKNEDGATRLMTPEEAVAAGIISDEQLKVIGERIPTEDKYSIIPMKIKGFNPNFSGESVIMPAEITLLTGSDFDIDKMYLSMKSFNRKMKVVNEDGMKDWKKINDFAAGFVVTEFYQKLGLPKLKSTTPNAMNDEVIAARNDITNTENLIRAKQDYELWKNIYAKKIDKIINGTFEAEDEMDQALMDYFEENKDKLGITYYFTERAGDNISGRTNRIFDLQWSAITSENSTDKLFDPGGFDDLSIMARAIRVLELADYSEQKYGSYDELIRMSKDDLDAILIDQDDINPMLPSSNILFQQRNAAAMSMVGMCANNSTAHAFLSDMNIHLTLNSKNSFTFNGRLVLSDKIDPTFNENGDYISKIIASYLAASVDARKDSVLPSLNFNTFTSNNTMLLLRLGFDPETVSLFMSLPTIKELAKRFQYLNNTEGYANSDALIEQYKSENKGKTFESKNFAFTKEEIVSALSGDPNYEGLQWAAVGLFQKLSTVSGQLQALSMLTKYNTLSFGAGPTLGDVLAQVLTYQDWIRKYTNGKGHIFDEKALDVIYSNAALLEFYDSTVSEGENKQIRTYHDGKSAKPLGKTPLSTVSLSFRERMRAALGVSEERAESAGDQFKPTDSGLVKAIFERYVPHYSTHFRNAFNTFINSIHGRPSPTEINRFFNAYMLACVSTFNNENERSPFQLTAEKKDYLLSSDPGGFIDEFSHFQEHSDNPLIRDIIIVEPNIDCPFRTLSLDHKTAGDAQISAWQDAFLDLYNDPTSRAMALDIIAYEVFRGGLSYSPTKLGKIIPSSLKAELEGYVDGLNSWQNFGSECRDAPVFNERNFVIQYLRNNTDDSKLVPQYNTPEGEKKAYRISPKTGVITFYKEADLSGLVTHYGEDVTGNAMNGYALVINVDGRIFVRQNTFDSRETSDRPLYKETGPLGIRGQFLEINMDMNGDDASIFEYYKRRYAAEHGMEVGTSFTESTQEDFNDDEEESSISSMLYRNFEFALDKGLDLTTTEKMQLYGAVQADETLTRALSNALSTDEKRKVIFDHFSEKLKLKEITSDSASGSVSLLSKATGLTATEIQEKINEFC